MVVVVGGLCDILQGLGPQAHPWRRHCISAEKLLQIIQYYRYKQSTNVSVLFPYYNFMCCTFTVAF